MISLPVSLFLLWILTTSSSNKVHILFSCLRLSQFYKCIQRLYTIKSYPLSLKRFLYLKEMETDLKNTNLSKLKKVKEQAVWMNSTFITFSYFNRKVTKNNSLYCKPCFVPKSTLSQKDFPLVSISLEYPLVIYQNIVGVVHLCCCYTKETNVLLLKCNMSKLKW